MAPIQVGEVVGGLFAHSLAVLTDAAHMLSDVLAFVISLCAGTYALRASKASHTFGYHRAEVLGSMVSQYAQVCQDIVNLAQRLAFFCWHIYLCLPACSNHFEIMLNFKLIKRAIQISPPHATEHRCCDCKVYFTLICKLNKR